MIVVSIDEKTLHTLAEKTEVFVSESECMNDFGDI